MNNPTQLKVLSTIWRNPGLSRKDLESITGFHANTVARAVDSLLYRGYIRESPTEPQSGRGRPRIPLSVDPARRCVGGLAIGAGAVEAATLNLQGALFGEVVRIEVADSTQITQAVGTLWGRLLQSKPLAIGVSVTGFADPERQRMLFSSAAPSTEVDLEPIFRRTGETPIELNSDVHAMAVRWMTSQIRNETEDVLMVTLEDGAVGASFLVNGVPNRGCMLGGNELGHTRLAGIETERCYCGGIGCVERVFSTKFLNQHGDGRTLGAALSEAKLSASAQQVVDYLAIGLLNATVFVRPVRVVIGGTLIRHATFREALETSWRQQLPAIFKNRIVLEW